ncbi:hypothetical protein [Thermoflexus sp.]|uniref:hypothetical protein n=1 Tax=Thermoflexus sp. TaxID=1969742 RepID=UPI0035E4141D
MAALIGHIAHGAPVWIIREDSAWSRIRTLEGASGYVPVKALRYASQTDRPITCVRATERLRLRAGQGSSSTSCFE